RDAGVETAEGGHDRTGRGSAVESPLGRLLDGRAVHHRVRERDPHLDGVGPGGGHRPHHVGPVVAQAAGHVGNQQLATPGAGRRQHLLDAPRTQGRSSRTRATSLSPRPDSVIITVDPAGSSSVPAAPPAASTPTRRAPVAANPEKVPAALEPPPTHATTTSGSPPSSSCRHWCRASSPRMRWNSRTIHGYGWGPMTDPRQ